jgi:hypothetical protein
MSQNQTQQMNKHKFNIFPEANAEDFARLLDDIRTNGFDKKHPVTIYQGEVLDGWNRTKVCDQLRIHHLLLHLMAPMLRLLRSLCGQTNAAT